MTIYLLPRLEPPAFPFRTLSGSRFEMCDPFGTNSRPTFWLTPPKPPGVWAAAAIKRAWAFERGGMGYEPFDFGVDVGALEVVGELEGCGFGGEGRGRPRGGDPAQEIVGVSRNPKVDVGPVRLPRDYSPHQRPRFGRLGGRGRAAAPPFAKPWKPGRSFVMPSFRAARDVIGFFAIGQPFTLLSRGLAFFAPALARRVPAASIAPARAGETPCFRAILFCTALKPGCAFATGMLSFTLTSSTFGRTNWRSQVSAGPVSPLLRKILASSWRVVHPICP